MAIRKPLVIVAGQVQQLQSGDTLDVSVTETSVVTMTNGEGVAALVPGNAVYVSANGTVMLAGKETSGTKTVLGLAKDDIDAGAQGEIVTNGVLTMLTGWWDAVTGQTGGLTAGKKYYLGSAGALEEGPPTATDGEYVVELGIALSTTELKVEPKTSILL